MKVRIPELVAHRGYALHYPENTLIGIEAAIRVGACFIEVDVQLTADKVPVLFHDRNMDRLCRVPGAIHDFTRAQLRDFNVLEFDRFGYKFAHNPITTLAELGALLTRYPQVSAFIEIKRVAVEHFGAQTVLDNVLHSLQRPRLYRYGGRSWYADRGGFSQGEGRKLRTRTRRTEHSTGRCGMRISVRLYS